MIRREHILYDLREALVSPKLLLGLLAIAALFILLINFQFILLFGLLFVALFGIRGLIGRRCPQCDGSIEAISAEPDKQDAFVMNITWRCPRDGYEELEKTKGDAGLFGVN